MSSTYHQAIVCDTMNRWRTTSEKSPKNKKMYFVSTLLFLKEPVGQIIDDGEFKIITSNEMYNELNKDIDKWINLYNFKVINPFQTWYYWYNFLRLIHIDAQEYSRLINNEYENLCAK